MPVVTFDYNDFTNLLGYEISKEKLVEKLPMIGADLDKVKEDEISIEFFPNRPDLASVEGIARASRAFFDFEKGLKNYNTKESDVVLNVDESVKKVRPHIATALIKNVTMADALVTSLMELQEKLHMGLGRNRKKVAIGVHNFEPIEPPFTYKAVDPDSIQFVPLGKVESMAMSEILKHHEKGVVYADILQDFDKHPVIVDSNDNVLSYPPIINGVLTEVTPFTENIFLDVTGTDRDAVRYALNIVSTALAERSGEIYTTTVKDKQESFILPDLSPQKNEISLEYINRILGTDMSGDKAVDCLRRMGHNAKMKEDKVLVESPSWRADILHDVDLVEDVAVGYGFDSFETMLPKELTFGRSLPSQDFIDSLRAVLIGLGFNEVNTFTISNEKDEFHRLNMEEQERVEIANPIGEEYNCLRVSLLPSLLKILNENRHHSLPQKIFETGFVVDENSKNRCHLGF
ncbi:MAG: phenylalanine--tRNA ligase subunit beta, partial [Candidatus Thermoplasmatota archaeon]